MPATALDLNVVEWQGEFKLVKKRPPRFECILCSEHPGKGYVMDTEAMEHHAKEEEHQKRVQKRNAGWIAGAGENWAAWSDLPKDPPKEDNLQWACGLRNEKELEIEKWILDVAEAMWGKKKEVVA